MAPLWLQPPPSCTACPGRAVWCCGPLQRAAQAVVTGEHEGRATGGRRENAVYSTYPLEPWLLDVGSIPGLAGRDTGQGVQRVWCDPSVADDHCCFVAGIG